MDNKQLIRQQDMKQAKKLMEDCELKWTRFLEAQKLRDESKNESDEWKLGDAETTAYEYYTQACARLYRHLHGSKILDSVAD